jgi:hypothetical protein
MVSLLKSRAITDDGCEPAGYLVGIPYGVGQTAYKNRKKDYISITFLTIEI